MALNLVPLCETPKLATRDGYAGHNAHLFLIGDPTFGGGYWYADGKQLAFPNSTVAQNPALSISGESKNLPYTKAQGFCINPNV